jgi:hypothetical protein
MEGVKAKDNWTLVSNKTPFAVEQQRMHERLQNTGFQECIVKAESAKSAYKHVLEKAGTIRRDAVERRIIEDVRSGQPRYQGRSANKPGIIDSPADTEGWPTYADAQPVADNDHDGMADDWERDHGLDPSNADDRNLIVSKDGYTALEAYLCSLMGENIKFKK